MHVNETVMNNIDLSNLSPEQLIALSDQVAQAKQNLELALPDISRGGQGRPTLTNTETMLRHYAITVRHNEMTKEMDIDIPGVVFSTDTAMNAKLAHIKSLARKHELNPADIYDHLTIVANANSFHPVRDWMDTLVWDGRDRLPDYYESVQLTTPNPMKEIMMRKWALSLVAALYHPGFSCEGVLTLSGAQGLGKTIWIEELIPPEYHNVWNKDAVIIDTKNKDTVSKALGYWITELGEIDATFRRSDIEALKAFITEKVDMIRPPYERTANKYPRRTVFYATVNEQEFLQDTQNRRFWVLEVAGFDLGRIDAGQFWAQMRNQYMAIRGKIATGALRRANQEWGWFMSPDEQELMRALQDVHKVVDPVEQLLESRIILDSVTRLQAGLGEKLNVTEILRRCGQYPISKRETTIGARWLRQQGLKSDRQKRWTVVIESQAVPWTFGNSRNSGTTGADEH
jgi:putative DNA primase/helicase